MTESHSRPAGVLWRALLGIRTGVLGAGAMLAWFFSASALLGHPVWTIPNLLGTLINHEAVLRRGFGMSSVHGVALMVFCGGLVGALFSLAFGGLRSRLRVVLLGVIVGLIGWWVSNALAWRKLGALAFVYSSPRTLLVAHLIFGAVLGSLPLESAGPLAPPQEAVPPAQDAGVRLE